MADFSALKTSIQNYIKQNGNEEITGNLLQQILLSMVSTLGDSAINDLVTALNAEIANRGNADTTLQGNIDNEATARGNADTELGGRITTLQVVVNGIKANVENGYVYAGIATPSSTPASGKVFYLALTAGTYTNFGATVVQQGINILKYNGSAWSLDSFLGLDDAPTQGSNNLVKSGGIHNDIQNAVNVEKTRALQAEATLQQSINTEKNRAINAENNLHEEVLVEKNERKQEIVGVRDDVLSLIHDYQPIVIEGNVVNAPDEEDITQEHNNLLKFKDKAYNPTIFSGLGKKYLRRNVLINEDYISFDGFVINPQAEDVLEGEPDAVLWDRLRERFIAQKDEKYYLDWQGSSIYLPIDGDKIYVNENIPYFWNGEDLAVDDNVIERYGNKLTQDMLSEENTVYIIQYDYTLIEDLTIPANCVLVFDGGSISAGSEDNMDTITLDKTRIIGYGGFDKSITLAGTIEGDVIEFDWWKNEKVSKADYNTFVANGYLNGIIPAISDTNRTILTKHYGLGMVKFGKGIYPFDAAMYVDNLRICADCEFDTLLWAPQTDLFIIGGGFNGIIKNLYIEANGNVIKCFSAGTYGLHRYEFKDSTLISYSDHCITKVDTSSNKAVPYGWLFENVKLYAAPNMSAIHNMTSNSMTFHNVVDAHVLFNQITTNKRGLMFAMFHNSNIQSFDNSNMTYAGWKYFYYVDKNGIWNCFIHNCTFEGGNNDKTLIANIIKVTPVVTSLSISMRDITLLSNKFDIAPIYINGVQSGFIDVPQINTICCINGSLEKIANYGNMIYYITNGLDAGGTRRRVGILYPTKNTNTVRSRNATMPVTDLLSCGFPQSIVDIFTEEEVTGTIYRIDKGNACDIFNRGTSAARPLGTGAGNSGSLLMGTDEGFKYFDTTLGKPIYAKTIAADGTVTWVDATGTTV